MIVLETERLILRRLEPGDQDAGFMLELMNEPGWLQFIGDRGVRTLEEARSYIERAVTAQHARHGFSMSCVVARDAGVAVGICGLVQRDTLPEPDLGFASLERWSGRGLAREAAAAATEHAHAVLRLRRILAVTSPENERSLRLLEGIGFRHEGGVRLAPTGGESLLLAHEAAGGGSLLGESSC